MTKVPADLIAFVIALCASLVLTIPIRYFALRYGMVDKPGPRKVHLKPIPLLGGIAIFLGFALAVLLTRHGGPYEQILGILSGAMLVTFVGFLDDGGLLHHQVKLFVGMPVAAIILLVSGVRADFFSELISGPLGNFLDILFAIFCGQTMVRVLGAAVLGAALGFLRWNFNPAKIFMGDGGAMFLGFMMATLGLKMRPEGAQFPVTWFVPILILGVPVFDTTLISISRSRRGLLPFTSPGKDHTAHRLSNLGLGRRGAVVTLYCLAALYGTLALIVPRLSPAMAYSVAGILIVLGFAAILLLENAPYERQSKTPNSLAAD